MMKVIKNEELLAVLKERPDVLSDLEDDDWDDTQLSSFQRWKTRYESLSQLDKDIWYCVTLLGWIKTAELMQCSKSLLYKKMKKINAVLHEKVDI